VSANALPRAPFGPPVPRVLTAARHTEIAQGTRGLRQEGTQAGGLALDGPADRVDSNIPPRRLQLPRPSEPTPRRDCCVPNRAFPCYRCVLRNQPYSTRGPALLAVERQR
jgi:hypothetical protein